MAAGGPSDAVRRLRALCRWRPTGCIGRLLIWLLRALALAVLWEGVRRTVVRREEQRPKRTPSRADCHPVPSTIYRRPDPLIYDQYYLAAQGIAVTWDNPDIRVERNGAAIDPHDLQPAEQYDVVARIWNGSTDGPVANLPVTFSYLSFGIGTTSHPIGTAPVDLGVKGSAACPAFATMSWTTPAEPGHYCLQVQLDWFDDANPFNNLGQTNTDVKALNSPRAVFTVPVANAARDIRTLTLEVDSYVVTPPPPCPPADEGQPDAARRARLATQRTDVQAPAEGWSIAVDPPRMEIAPGESTEVTVEVEAPDDFEGTQAFNLNALDANRRLVGGVTLYVHS